jgi:hypothetical protein
VRPRTNKPFFPLPAPIPQPFKVNIVGDFEQAELESLVLAYLGTVTPTEGAGTPPDRWG